MDRRDAGQVVRCLLALLLLPALTGCMLSSGERSEQTLRPETGSLVTTFVGGDGEALRTLAVGQPDARYAVTVFVSADQGELRLELLDPQGAPVFVAQSRPGERLARSGVVQADAQGLLRYRVSARAARKGSYELFYQQP